MFAKCNNDGVYVKQKLFDSTNPYASRVAIIVLGILDKRNVASLKLTSPTHLHLGPFIDIMDSSSTANRMTAPKPCTEGELSHR